jgi:hypothetical protein
MKSIGNAIGCRRLNKPLQALTRSVGNGYILWPFSPTLSHIVERKNWHFLGSPAGGERVAIVATIIENCRMQGMNPYAYMLDTLAILHRGCTDYDSLKSLAQAETADRICGCGVEGSGPGRKTMAKPSTAKQESHRAQMSTT